MSTRHVTGILSPVIYTGVDNPNAALAAVLATGLWKTHGQDCQVGGWDMALNSWWTATWEYGEQAQMFPLRRGWGNPLALVGKFTVVDSKQEITGWRRQTDVFQCVFRIFHLFNSRILKTDVSRELSHNTGVRNKVLSLRLGPQCHKSLNFFPSLQLPPYIIYSLNVSLKIWSDPQFPLWTISPVHPQTPSHIGLKLHKAFLWV